MNYRILIRKQYAITNLKQLKHYFAYNSYDMSEEETEALLTEQQMQAIIRKQKEDKKLKREEGRLRNWVIYCKRRGKKSLEQQYQKQLHEVGHFCTLRAFYRFFYSIREPSTLETDTKIFFFLKDCKPFWQQWLQSGCLLIMFKFKDEQKDEIAGKLLNSTWQYLLFELIGNNLPKIRNGSQENLRSQKEGQQLIIGLILQRRQKIALIQVWYRNEISESKLTKLLKQDITSHLNLKTERQKSVISMRYKRHKDSIETNSTLKGSKYSQNFKLPSCFEHI